MAISLTSPAPLSVLRLDPDQTLLRTVVRDVVTHALIGGVASTSVVVMTACAPVLGWLIYRRRISALLAVLVSLGVCFASVVVGLAVLVVALAIARILRRTLDAETESPRTPSKS